MSSPSEENPAVDIEPELQREIVVLAKALPQLNYYQVLGVNPGVPAPEVRDAFFQKSRRYHPDRFFRKELGAFGPILTEIYKRIVAAHDVLRDPDLRASYDRGLGIPAEAAADSAAPEPTAESEPAPEPKPTPQPKAQAPASRRRRPATKSPAKKKGLSLRKRSGLRSKQHLLQGLEKQLARSRSKAEQRYMEAQEHERRGELQQAAHLLKLAMAFAPRERRYARRLENILPKANEARAVELQKRAELVVAAGDKPKALELYLELVDLKPMDAELAHSAARLIVQLEGDAERGVELASRAVSLNENFTPYRKTLAQLYLAAGEKSAARREFERVWKADPLDEDVKAALGQL